VNEIDYSLDREGWIMDRRNYGPKFWWPWEDSHAKFHTEDPVECVAKAIKDKGLESSTIGVELSHAAWVRNILTVNIFERLKKALPKAVYKDISPILSQLRMIKSAREIETIEEFYKKLQMP